jgi:hypothetical protein
VVGAPFGARPVRSARAVLVLAPEAAAATPAGSKTFSDEELRLASSFAAFESFGPLWDSGSALVSLASDNSAELASAVGSTSSLSATL